MEYPRLSGPNCKGRPMIIWLEVVNKDLKELGMCKADALDRMRLKQLICKVLLEAGC